MKSLKSLIKRFKPLLIAILAFALAVAVATPTIAYYIITGGKVQGDYQPGEPSPPIIEEESPNPVIRMFALDADNTTMKDVYISVPDYGYPVFVRVALLVTWLKPADCTCLLQPKCSEECTCEICVVCTCEECTCEDCEWEAEGTCTCEECTCEDCLDCKKCSGEADEKCEGCLFCGETIYCGDILEDEEGKQYMAKCADDCSGCNASTQTDDGNDSDELPIISLECNELDRNECPVCNDDTDDDYDIFFQIPELGENKDYTMALGKADENSSAGSWVANAKNSTTNEVFYYYSIPVQSNGTATDGSEPTQIATPLLTEFVFLSETAKPPMEGCILNVEIIVQTIQAIGYTDENDDPAWKDAWKDHVYDKWETVTY